MPPLQKGVFYKMRPIKFRAWGMGRMDYPEVYEMGVSGVSGKFSISYQCPSD